MRNKKLLIIALLLTVLIFLTFVMLINQKSGDLPGKVIGPNPHNIPEKELPTCNFTGAGFVEEPCYSPPDSLYL